jgi:hypothetical protein
MKDNHPITSAQKVRRWTGVFGIAGIVVFLAAMPLYFLGPSAVLPQASGFTDFVTKTNVFIVTRTTLADPLIFCCFLVFMAGFRQLIREANSDYEWVSTFVFGAGLLFIATQLVADALQGAGALDTFVGANPLAVRALFEGSAPLFSACGLIPEAFFLAFAGYATFATRLLPKWAGWVAIVGAVIVFADAPTIYLGFSGLIYSGVAGFFAAIAEFWAPIWILIASILLMQKREVKLSH